MSFNHRPKSKLHHAKLKMSELEAKYSKKVLDGASDTATFSDHSSEHFTMKKSESFRFVDNKGSAFTKLKVQTLDNNQSMQINSHMQQSTSLEFNDNIATESQLFQDNPKSPCCLSVTQKCDDPIIFLQTNGSLNGSNLAESQSNHLEKVCFVSSLDDEIESLNVVSVDQVTDILHSPAKILKEIDNKGFQRCKSETDRCGSILSNQSSLLISDQISSSPVSIAISERKNKEFSSLESVSNKSEIFILEQEHSKIESTDDSSEFIDVSGHLSKKETSIKDNILSLTSKIKPRKYNNIKECLDVKDRTNLLKRNPKQSHQNNSDKKCLHKGTMTKQISNYRSGKTTCINSGGINHRTDKYNKDIETSHTNCKKSVNYRMNNNISPTLYNKVQELSNKSKKYSRYRYIKINDNKSLIEDSTVINQPNLLIHQINGLNNDNYLNNFTLHESDECDNIITKLLKNQIHLIKSFTESHNQMYLYCCQAVSMLNKHYNN